MNGFEEKKYDDSLQCRNDASRTFQDYLHLCWGRNKAYVRTTKKMIRMPEIHRVIKTKMKAKQFTGERYGWKRGL